MAEVAVESSSMVLPATPTTRGFKTFSCLDLQMRSSIILPTRRVLFYSKPDIPLEAMVALLKASLATALVHFCPLAGRFHIRPHGEFCLDYNDAGVALEVFTSKAPLPEFGHAAENQQAIFPDLVPQQSCLPPDSPLVPPASIRVTQFTCGGIAIGCSVSHILADGTSLWHFLTSWAELSRSNIISLLPLHQPFQLGPGVEFAEAQEAAAPAPPVPSNHSESSSIFRFPESTIQRIKAEATHHRKLPFSTFVCLVAHWWKHVTHARSLHPDQQVRLFITASCRQRLNPPLPAGYFGNAVISIHATSTAGEIAQNELAFASHVIHQAIMGAADRQIRDQLRSSAEAGYPRLHSGFLRGIDLGTTSSHRFPLYQTDFGWGRPIAVRLGNYHGSYLLCDPSSVAGALDFTAFLTTDIIAKLRAHPQFLA